MGLRITTDMSVLKDKKLINTKFEKGSENILYLQTKDNRVERVRIPSYLVDAFNMYWSMNTVQDKVA